MTKPVFPMQTFTTKAQTAHPCCLIKAFTAIVGTPENFKTLASLARRTSLSYIVANLWRQIFLHHGTFCF